MTPEPLVGEVRGFRIFWPEDDGSLSSGFVEYTWSPGRNEATCEDERPAARPKTRHGLVPAPGCKCGFWMYKDLERGARMFRVELLGEPEAHPMPTRFGAFDEDVQAVLGEVSGWGRVREGEDGWRVQFARIRALIDISQDMDLSDWAGTYDVPVVRVDVDLAISHAGQLTARGEDVGKPMRMGIRLGDRLFVVPKDSAAFFPLHRIPLGAKVAISLDPSTWEVAEVEVVEGSP